MGFVYFLKCCGECGVCVFQGLVLALFYSLSGELPFCFDVVAVFLSPSFFIHLPQPSVGEYLYSKVPFFT